MTRAILALCATILLLAACTPAQQPVQAGDTTPEQPTLPEPSDGQPALPAPSEPKSDFPTPGEPDRTAFADLPSDVKSVMEQAETKAGAGLSYMYQKIESNLPSDDIASEATVYQKGSTMKLVLDDTQVLDVVKSRDLVYDVAIIDVEEKTVQAYCTDIKACKGNTGKRSASYDDLIFVTPLYWLENMRSPEKVGQGTIDGRSTYQLKATVEDRDVTVSVDRYSGVPVEVTDGTTVYKYQKLALGVKDSDLQP